MAGDWRRMRNKELYNLYTSPNIVRAIKSRRMRLTGHVAWMYGWEMQTKLWLENL